MMVLLSDQVRLQKMIGKPNSCCSNAALKFRHFTVALLELEVYTEREQRGRLDLTWPNLSTCALYLATC